MNPLAGSAAGAFPRNASASARTRSFLSLLSGLALLGQSLIALSLQAARRSRIALALPQELLAVAIEPQCRSGNRRGVVCPPLLVVIGHQLPRYRRSLLRRHGRTHS